MNPFFKAVLPRLFTLMRFCARLWERVGRMTSRRLPALPPPFTGTGWSGGEPCMANPALISTPCAPTQPASTSGGGKTNLARKIFLPAAIALMALAGMNNAAAQTTPCGIQNPAGVPVPFNQINVQTDAPVGAVIATATQNYSVTCPAATTYSGIAIGYYFTFTANTAGGWGSTADPTIWKTPVGGIGMRVTNLTDGKVLQYCSTSYSIAANCLYGNTFTSTQSFAQFTYAFTLQYELIKTGTTPTTSTAMPAIPILWLSSRGITCTGTGTGCYTGMTAISFGPNVTILPSTCTVKTPSISITLPQLTVSDLGTLGATGGVTPFQIDLACNGTTLKNVYINLTDATTPSNTSGQLTLASGPGAASGVQLQILQSNGQAISFGPDTAVQGNPGQWTAGPLSTAASSISIPLTAQYVSIGPVTPGTVKATATFTLYYQ